MESRQRTNDEKHPIKVDHDATKDDQELYKRSWKKQERKLPMIERLCFYSKLSITFEALLVDGWATFDWLNDITWAEMDHELQHLKAMNPQTCFRAINRTTGRMVDFA